MGRVARQAVLIDKASGLVFGSRHAWEKEDGDGGHSNSHCEVLVGIRRPRDLQALEHAVQAMVPALTPGERVSRPAGPERRGAGPPGPAAPPGPGDPSTPAPSGTDTLSGAA